ARQQRGVGWHRQQAAELGDETALLVDREEDPPRPREAPEARGERAQRLERGEVAPEEDHSGRGIGGKVALPARVQPFLGEPDPHPPGDAALSVHGRPRWPTYPGAVKPACDPPRPWGKAPVGQGPGNRYTWGTNAQPRFGTQHPVHRIGDP